MRLRALPEGPADTGFWAGGALASLHAMAIDEHPIGSLWRDRLALTNAAALMELMAEGLGDERR